MDQSQTVPTNPPGAVGSLVCGILSIVLGWAFFGVPGVVLGIIALVLAGKAKKAALAAPGRYLQGGARTGGFICGLIGLILSAVIMVIAIIAVAFVTTAGPKVLEDINKQLEEQNRLQREREAMDR